MKRTLLIRHNYLMLLVFLLAGIQNVAIGQTFVQNSDGLVVINAENFSQNNPGTGIKLGDEWEFSDAFSGFEGTGYMQSVMAAGDGSFFNADNYNAKLTYNVEFINTGQHYLWAHVYFPDGSGDSFFYGIDGSAKQRVEGTPYGTFTWKEGNFTSSFSVPSVGMHTIDIMQREPGAVIDHIIVTSDASFDPTTDDSWKNTYDQNNDALGLVVIDAENNSDYRKGTGIKAGDRWMHGSSQAGYLGTGYVESIMLGGGDGSTSNAENFNAKISYDVNFVKTGTHYIWAHVYYPGGSGDSFFYGLDGGVKDRADNTTHGSFFWDKGNSGFTIPSTGLHTIDIMQREPGVLVDHIIVTSDASFDPTTDNSWLPTDSDASLSDLSVNGYDISPAFDPGITSYSIVTGENPGMLTVSATPTSDGATYVITQNGDVITVTVTADDGETTLTYTIYLQTLCVIQAEDYISSTGGYAGEQWTEATSVPGFYGGSYMLAPNYYSYAPYQTAQANAPALTYEVTVGQAGTYYLWSYINFPNGDGDSFYYGVNGSIPSESHKLSSYPNYDFWLWAKGPQSVQLQAGTNTVTIYAREKGMRVDMLLLTPHNAFDPRVDGGWVDCVAPTVACPGPIVTGNDAGQCGAAVTWELATTDSSEGLTVVCTIPGDAGGSPNGCATTSLNLSITFDNFPEETSWRILDMNEAVVLSGGTYGNEPDGSTINIPITLPDGNYQFMMMDGFGDGMCCTYGNGSYSLTSNGEVIASGGSFGSKDITPFCVEAPAAGNMIEVNSGDFFPVGTTTVTCTVTNAEGLMDVCSFDVTVNDTEAPTLSGSCPGGVTLCGAQTVNWTPPTATDNCAVVSSTNNYNPGDFFDVGTHMVTYTFYDAAGLFVSCSFIIHINPLPVVEIPQSYLPEWCQGVKTLYAKVANIAELADPLSFEWNTGETTQEILATANGAYSVIVTDGNNCSTTAMTVVDEDLEELLSAHTILVDDEMDMDYSTVISGGVGVLDADEVSIQDNSDITTFLVSSQAFVDGSSSVADYYEMDSPVSLPDFINNPYYDNNNQTINGTATLSGSNYGHVSVIAGSTLYIDNAEVYMKSLDVGKTSTVIFNQPGILVIKQKMTIGSLCNINVEGPGVVVYVGGETSIGQGSTVAVNIYAGEQMDVNDSGSSMTTTMLGMFITDELNSGDNVVWGWNLTCGGVETGGGDDCVSIGTASGQLPAVLKGVDGFCSTVPAPVTTCDCPPGYVVVGYEGLTGNSYGGAVISQFSLRCKQLNSNGTLGNTVMVTCSNGSLTSGSPSGPLDAGSNEVMVGAQVRTGCALDWIQGYSKPLSQVIAGSPNASSSPMPVLGNTAANPQPTQYVPAGHVIVGMETYEETNPPSGFNVLGVAAGVAWRYAPISECIMPNMAASIGQEDAIDVSSNRIDDLVVFPNPSSGELGVNVENFIGSSVKVVITNVMGQQVWFREIDQLETARLTIDLTADRYPSGMYLMTFVADDEQVTKQIILSK